MGRKYTVISGDGHIEIPPDPWVSHVPAKHRDRAPRLVHLPDGQGDGWIVEGRSMLWTGQNVSGAEPMKFSGCSYVEDGRPRAGTGDAGQRLREQDEDGIDAEVLFAPLFASRFIQGISDREAYLAMVRAYNEWLAEDYCSVAPDRLIGNAIIPVSGLDDALAELDYAKSVGLRTVMLNEFPNGSSRAKPEDDAFWERSLELGLALSPHGHFGQGRMPKPQENPAAYPAWAGISRHTPENTPGTTLAQMIVSGVFDRIPELRLYFAETNCSLLPGMLYYLDRDYDDTKEWFGLSLKRLPSEYVIDHCLFGMVQEVPAVKMALAGIMPMDWFIWGSDFPHAVNTFPKSAEFIAETFADLDEATRRKVLVDTAVSFFGLDPDADLTETPAA
jgi:predicted TIM-barrel fold metal-dependent hydrolase